MRYAMLLKNMREWHSRHGDRSMWSAISRRNGPVKRTPLGYIRNPKHRRTGRSRYADVQQGQPFSHDLFVEPQSGLFNHHRIRVNSNHVVAAEEIVRRI